MGNEAVCRARFSGKEGTGKALLESETLLFRSPGLRLKIPFASITGVADADGVLTITFPNGVAAFELGVEAAKWAVKIRSPRSRLDKLGVKDGVTALLVDVDDAAFQEELETRATVVTKGPADLVFLGASKAAQLAKIGKLIPKMARDGALWVIRPKGVAEITEKQVMEAGKAAGLVDTKVVRFSETHTAEKLVIRVRDR